MTMNRTKEELKQLKRDVIALNTPDDTGANSHCRDASGSDSMRRLVSNWRKECDAQSGYCRSYLCRNRRCPHCPREYADELEEILNQNTEVCGASSRSHD